MIARLLYQLPLYQAWDQIDLPQDIKDKLDDADQQRLLSIVAYSLQRLMLSQQQEASQDCA